MKPLYTARHPTDAHLIWGYLESAGITAVVRGEYLAGGIGELPADLCQVYVMHDSDWERADLLLRGFLRGDAARMHMREAWQCPRCNESLEGQFTACWNCGLTRTD